MYALQSDRIGELLEDLYVKRTQICSCRLFRQFDRPGRSFLRAQAQTFLLMSLKYKYSSSVQR